MNGDIFSHENLNDILENCQQTNDDTNIVAFPDSNSITANVENQELSSDNSPFTLSLRREEFSDDKELIKFIRSVEKQVRTSPEYREWTSYIKETLGYYTSLPFLL